MLQAAALATGLLVQTNSGFAEVKNNIVLDTTATVYNFTVENNHTYFVGREQLLVHNDCKKLAKILDDLGDKSDELVTFLKTVPVARHPKILEAVEMLQSKIGVNTQFAVDPATLNKLADYLSPANANKLTAIGGKIELEKFLAKHGDVPCGICGTGGRPVFGPRNLDEMIENFVEVGYNFRNHQTLWNKLKQGTASANAAMREDTVLKKCVKLKICNFILRTKNVQLYELYTRTNYGNFARCSK